MKKLIFIIGIIIMNLLTSCTSSTNNIISTTNTGTNTTNTNIATGSMASPESFPAEAKTIIDKIMAARQSGDTVTADTLQKELDTKFPNLPKPGAGGGAGPQGGSGGLMSGGGVSSIDTRKSCITNHI